VQPAAVFNTPIYSLVVVLKPGSIDQGREGQSLQTARGVTATHPHDVAHGFCTFAVKPGSIDQG